MLALYQIISVSGRADVTQRDQFLWTPLHHAAFAGQVELVKLLVEEGASVNALSLNRGTPLMNAILSSRPSCVDTLILAGANVVVENKRGILEKSMLYNTNKKQAYFFTFIRRCIYSSY